MNSKKEILEYTGGRTWTWIAGIILAAAGILICSMTDSVLILLAIVMIFVGVYYLLRALIVDLPAIRREKKCLERLEIIHKLEQAAAELAANDRITIGKNKAISTDNFLFGRQIGTAFCYEDILWIYKRRFTQRVMGIPVKTVDSLIVSTASQREVCAVNLGRKDKNNELDAIVARVHNKNPHTLVGYTPENKKACKEMIKA